MGIFLLFWYLMFFVAGFEKMKTKTNRVDASHIPYVV